MAHCPDVRPYFTKFIQTALMLIVALSAAGCNRGLKAEDRFEGFRNSTLRVYIRIADQKGRGDEALRGIFTREGKKRAEQIFSAYIRAHVSDETARKELLAQTGRYSMSPSIVSQKCDNHTCEAFLDFNASELFGSIQSPDITGVH
jgi:hypothetical protein